MTDTVSIPEGFKPARIGGAFMTINGPLYARLQHGRLQLGFRVEARHTNPLNICHGGMLASFADMLLPCVAIYQPDTEPRFYPTISLQVDYLGAASLGAWVQGEGEVLRTTRNMVFLHGLVTADAVPALRISGIFKRGAMIEGSDSDPLDLRG